MSHKCKKHNEENENQINEEINENCNHKHCHCKDDNDCQCENDFDCECNEKCDCEDDCHCSEDDKCSDNCECAEDRPKKCSCETENKDYLSDLLRVQAEFDNYRKRMQTALGDARQDGFVDAIEKFLPALDSFKMATDMITDKNTLMGIKFIEKGILDTLSKMGVNEIDCTGAFDPNFHQAIDTDTTTDAPPGTITKVAYKGFTYKDKVIRYAQVIVKK